MVVFDTTTIVLLIDSAAQPPIDPATGRRIERCEERIEHLITGLSHARTRVLIPTPVLAEFLVKAGPNKEKFLTEFIASRHFLIGSFDQRAAIELSYLQDGDAALGRKIVDTKAKVKFDRQILAIAKIQGASTIYTDDTNLAALADKNGIRTVMTWEIPLPPPKTGELFANESR